MQELARLANFGTWSRARECIERVVDIVSRWGEYATEVGVGGRTKSLVARQLHLTYRENRALLGRIAPGPGRG